MGRRERERVRGLESAALTSERRPRREKDEIAAERGVQLILERGGTCLQDFAHLEKFPKFTYR